MIPWPCYPAVMWTKADMHCCSWNDESSPEVCHPGPHVPASPDFLLAASGDAIWISPTKLLSLGFSGSCCFGYLTSNSLSLPQINTSTRRHVLPSGCWPTATENQRTTSISRYYYIYYIEKWKSSRKYGIKKSPLVCSKKNISQTQIKSYYLEMFNISDLLTGTLFLELIQVPSSPLKSFKKGTLRMMELDSLHRVVALPIMQPTTSKH